MVYNGVREEYSAPKSPQYLEKVRNKYGLPDRFNLFLGNLDPRKNSPNTLRAYLIYERISGESIPLVTPGLPRDTVMQLLKSEGSLAKKDLFICSGYIDAEYLPGVYHLADHLLFPSLKEGFGLPILEAMASGTPVVTSFTSSMPETAGDAALQVNPASPAEIADALLKLSRDQELYNKLCALGKSRAQLFTWDKTASSVLQVYETLAQKALIADN